MKDSLFEMLLSLFEKTLAQLKEKYQAVDSDVSPTPSALSPDTSLGSSKSDEIQVEVFKAARGDSMRVFTPDERLKFTKASYQFLQRLISWNIVTPQVLELIINRLMFSESRFVNLEETKWAIRTTLAEGLDAEQLAFLDLVLFQKDDIVAVH